MRLVETKLYEELISRDTENARYYSSFFAPLVRDMDTLLQYIKQQYPEFPDHGLQHSLRIIEYIGKIMSKEEMSELSDLEIFIFIFAAFFHDTGMVLYNSSKKEEIRAKHHCYAKEIITKYFNECLRNLSYNERIKDAVIFVCYAHGLQMSELILDRHFTIVDTISCSDVRYSLLAFLLRIGDLMDLEGERANNFRMSMFSEAFSENAYNHNRRHQKVRLYNYSSSKIMIEVEAENIQQYRIWSEWFSYLRDDIFNANNYLKDTGITFPLPETKIVTGSGNNFEIQELRFEIDEKGGIWDIISKSIYTNELDFVRELVQNAIDATLKKIYINEEIEINNVSPRFWNIYDTAERILVIYSEKKQKLYVTDHGIGMDKDDLINFLFKVSSSGKVDKNNRKFSFPGIAQYGIGFVSCLINAEKIQIYTCKQDSPQIHYVTMESKFNVAFIQNIANNNSFSGTVIELDLKHNFSYKKIHSYLSKTFRYTSVKVSFIKFENLERTIEEIPEKSKYKSILERPYLLSEAVLKVSQYTQNIIELLDKDRENIIAYEKQVKHLKNSFEKNHQTFSDKRKLADYNEQVSRLKECAPFDGIKKKFPNIMIWKYNHKEAELIYQKVMKDISEYELEIVVERGRCNSKIDKLSLGAFEISAQKICFGGEWRYLAVFYDSDFCVYDIQYSLNPIDISEKTGIIFLKYSNQDSMIGIEFVGISGFLFQKGEICNRLARVSGYSDYMDIRKTPKSYVIGINGYYDDIREDVQNYFVGEYYEDDELYNTDYARLSAEYDVISISENNIIRLNNQDVFRQRNIYEDDYDEKIDLYDEMLKANKDGKNDFINTGLAELNDFIPKEVNAYYQDGIAIPSGLNSLFPVGFFRIVCNCTADARMKLNVTRHELSEVRSDIEKWMDSTGVKIQELICDSLMEMLDSLGVCVELEELINPTDDANYFSQLATEKVKSILKKKR